MTTPTPEERLARWRDNGDDPDIGYTAGNHAFAADVVALLNAIAALREQVATLTADRDGLRNHSKSMLAEAMKLEADNAALRQEWHTVDGDFPRPHARYFVRRENEIFTATPCYGMHEPWWVPRLLGKESEPITMLVTDKYAAMREGEENP